MKQIGARQEAGRIGGTGPCGRELCCATWMKNFVSVSTGAARFQDISLNPQKLAGMCAKLKCCLNYEVDDYIEAGKRMPGRDVVLQTQDADYYLFKTDILAGLATYSTDKNIAANLQTITAAQAREVIEMNRRGEKPLSLQEEEEGKPLEAPHNIDLAGGDISRFDKNKKKKKKSKPRREGEKEGRSKESGDKKQEGTHAE
jgi:cell fate regulator YaaT (PSP1 superfamily)